MSVTKISEREIPASLRPHFAVVWRLVEKTDSAKLKGKVLLAHRGPAGIEVQEMERDDLPPDLLATLPPGVDGHVVLIGEGVVVTVAVQSHTLSQGGNA